MRDWEYKPAGDAGLPPADRMRSLRREGGLPSVLAHEAWCALTAGYLRGYHRFHVEGREHLPARPPFVVVANHASHLDAVALAVGLPMRLREWAFPIAAGDVFFETKVNAAFAAIFLNALPMWRKKCGSHAMETLRERLVAGEAIYLLFPEGTRTRTGAMAAFRAGIGMLVAGTHVPVVPAHLDGCFAALPQGTKWPKPRKITLRFGAPRVFADAPDTREGWKDVAKALEAEVVRLRG
ncbi:MAG: lysophospholipid acyltransferase family protein [Terrimicrobiaceae bacterium]|nr:lysophospholipid acyltransferase family protein [Terrimicrobiaceae bacterium]